LAIDFDLNYFTFKMLIKP